MPMTDTDSTGVSQFLIPRGFRFGAVKAGLKKSGRTDFALIVADAPASAAAAFTANRVLAAPLIVDKENLRATGSRSAWSPSTPATPTAPPVYSAADVGFIAQNVYLYCASQGLAVVVRGSVDRTMLSPSMKLGSTPEIVMTQTVGIPQVNPIVHDG